MIKVVKKGKQCKLALEGELTIYNAVELKDGLLKHLRASNQLEIDLSRVHELDTAGLQVLACAKKDAANNNTPFSLVNHSRSVIEVLDLYNMSSYFGDPVLISKAQV
jgi:anti-sigma B factor antagonist